MSRFITGARLVFPLADVVAAAEHAAASPAHRMADGDISPGDPRRKVHTERWGPGTDTWELLGGDDICEPYPLCEKGSAEDGDTFLGTLRSALAEGNTDLVWEISAAGWWETRVTATRRRTGRTGRARG